MRGRATVVLTAAALLLVGPQSSALPERTTAPSGAEVEVAEAEGRRPAPDARNVVLAVHGGAGGGLVRKDTKPEVEKAYRDGLTAALRAGQKVLQGKGSSVDAVEAAVKVLEDDPLFNAGKGAVFTEDAGHELDASIMRGKDLAAGAVAGVRNVRNPISAARLVMDKSKHVLLAGEGADDFAARNGLPSVTQDYYWTQARWDQLMKAKNPATRDLADPQAHGTVGAVALDRSRDLAAATSTGGLTNKMTGRLGDSPVIGAGTYARNDTAAVSATGAGEVFIRGAAAGTISNLVEFGRRSLAEAAFDVVVKRLPTLGGQGGVIALNRAGEFDAPHSTPGMLHGYLTADGRVVTKVFLDETPANR
ncbi:isoaspartyl peptidase/L-asparaginase [Crossiella sp. CA-258035]|uniref:isoaspartyl peptidase/L-asparaginase family protein n=1 Tax=Crossiella sp. CA-258035 TaxID=2981138 RepID=UPI0024BD12DC|nr:isoaspartyl peptidase/L-asparaginase [Crossiella sp. CA-258035]WHT22162.1 isoaspartyl peptidase/L-asparaginase [Crossiella sp. CA-258035]